MKSRLRRTVRARPAGGGLRRLAGLDNPIDESGIEPRRAIAPEPAEPAPGPSLAELVATPLSSTPAGSPLPARLRFRFPLELPDHDPDVEPDESSLLAQRARTSWLRPRQNPLSRMAISKRQHEEMNDE